MRSEFLTNMLSLMVSFGTCSCLNVHVSMFMGSPESMEANKLV